MLSKPEEFAQAEAGIEMIARAGGDVGFGVVGAVDDADFAAGEGQGAGRPDG